MNNIEEILAASHYQTFDLIEGDVRDSNSKEKFKLSKLSSYGLQGKSCLDVGCNAGYFLFNLIDKEVSKLTGIDSGEKFVQISNDLNREVYKSPIINFILGDFLTYRFDEKFDFIICFSTFHYLGYDQSVFFDRCYNLLNNNCVLLLEVEEYPINDEPYIDVDPRDSNRLYPNGLKMQEYIKNRFTILDRYISTKQKGSMYDRWFYELKKV